MVAIHDHYNNNELDELFMKMEAIDVDVFKLSLDEIREITQNENIHTIRYLNLFLVYRKSYITILDIISKGRQKKIIIPGIRIYGNSLVQFLENPYIISLNVHADPGYSSALSQVFKNNYTLIEFIGLDLENSISFQQYLERNNKIRNTRIQKERERIHQVGITLLSERKFHSKKLNMEIRNDIPREILIMILKKFYETEYVMLERLMIDDDDIIDFIEKENMEKLKKINRLFKNKNV